MNGQPKPTTFFKDMIHDCLQNFATKRQYEELQESRWKYFGPLSKIWPNNQTSEFNFERGIEFFSTISCNMKCKFLKFLI